MEYFFVRRKLSHFVGSAHSFALNLLLVSVSLSHFTGAVWAGYLAGIYVTDSYLQVSSCYICYRQVFTGTYLAAIYVTDRY